MIGLGQVATVLIMGSQAIVEWFEGGEVWWFLVWSGSMLVCLTLVEVSCQISDTSDSSSGSEWVSSSSARRDLKEALAHACLATTLSELHWVAEWYLKTFSSFPEFLHISQNLERGGTALDRGRQLLPLEEEVCNELNLPIRTGSDSSSLHLYTSRSSVSNSLLWGVGCQPMREWHHWTIGFCSPWCVLGVLDLYC